MVIRGAIAALACLIASVAAAQERIDLLTVVGTQPRLVEVDATVSGFGDILNVTPLTDVSTSIWRTPVALAGGRYLAWAASSPTQLWDVVVFDRRTRQRFHAGLPLPALAPSDVVADPRRPRLFIVAAAAPPISPSEVWVVDAAPPGVRRLATLPSFAYGALYAATADLLFVRTASREILAIDVATGVVARRFPDTLGGGSMAVDAAATHLWHGAGLNGVQLVDARTGIVTATSNTGQLGELVLDEARRWVLGIEPRESQSGEMITALDAVTLTPVWRTRVSAQLPGLFRSVNPLAGRWLTGAYAVRTESRRDGPCNAIQVDAIDPDGARRATADILGRLGLPGGTTGCSVYPVLVRSPFAPRSLVATVAGATATLSWSDLDDTTEIEIEYGFAPSQRAGAIRIARTTSVTIPGVPTGTYWVRVRAVNDVGPSPPSDEVQVVVQ